MWGSSRIVPDNTTQGYAPEIRRGRALPETPATLRPIFQLVELEAVQNQRGDLVADQDVWLKDHGAGGFRTKCVDDRWSV